MPCSALHPRESGEDQEECSIRHQHCGSPVHDGRNVLVVALEMEGEEDERLVSMSEFVDRITSQDTNICQPGIARNTSCTRLLNNSRFLIRYLDTGKCGINIPSR